MSLNQQEIEKWLHVPRPLARPALRLFAFPYAGSTGSAYHAWARALPADVELCGVQLPGRLARIQEPSFTQLQPLVAVLAQVVEQRCEVPFLFYGHSMGTAIAFALTHELHRRGARLPLHLVVSGRGAPHLVPPRGDIHRLPRQAFIEQIQQFNGMPQLLLNDPDIMALVLPAMRADFALLAGIPLAPCVPLPVPIAAWGGTQDLDAPEEAIRAWAEHTNSEFTARFFNGGHFFINDMRSEVLAALSSICINSTARDNGANFAWA